MAKHTVSEAQPKKPEPRWVRCTATLSIRVTGSDRAEHLWSGLVVNLDREIAPGVTIGHALSGREDCYAPCEAPGETPMDPIDPGPQPVEE